MRRFALLCASVFSTVAWAYSPPPAFIVKTMAAKHGALKGVRLRSTLTAGSTPARFKVTHLYNTETGILKSTVSDEAGRSLYLFEHGFHTVPLSLDVPIQAIGTFLLESNSQHVLQALQTQGLTTTTPTFLARWNKSIAWVIGQRTNGRGDAPSTQAQLWVEKDTFLPLRWVDKNKIEFQSYHLFHGVPYPRLLTFGENLKEEVTDLKANPPELSRPQKTETNRGFTETGRSLPPSDQALIQRYFEPT